MKSLLFKINLSLLLSLVASFSFGQASNGIVFKKQTQKFTKVDENKLVRLVYRFSNYTKFVVSIKPPKVDCSCTEVILPSNRISSGAKDSIIILFDTKDKLGWQERDVVLHFTTELISKPIEKKLTFKGMVKASKATKATYKANKKKN